MQQGPATLPQTGSMQPTFGSVACLGHIQQRLGSPAEPASAPDSPAGPIRTWPLRATTGAAAAAHSVTHAPSLSALSLTCHPTAHPAILAGASPQAAACCHAQLAGHWSRLRSPPDGFCRAAHTPRCEARSCCFAPDSRLLAGTWLIRPLTSCRWASSRSQQPSRSS